MVCTFALSTNSITAINTVTSSSMYTNVNQGCYNINLLPQVFSHILPKFLRKFILMCTTKYPSSKFRSHVLMCDSIPRQLALAFAAFVSVLPLAVARGPPTISPFSPVGASAPGAAPPAADAPPSVDLQQ